MPTVHTESKLNERIKTLDEALTLDSRALDAMVRRCDSLFRPNMTKLFDTEGASGGPGKWLAWEPKYAKYRLALYEGTKASNRATKYAAAAIGLKVKLTNPVLKILHLSGKLRRSLNTTGGDHVAEWVNENGNYVIRLGTLNPVATYHYEGIPSKDGPKVRNPFRHTVDQRMMYRVAITTVVNDFLAQAWRGLAKLKSLGALMQGGAE